jgi:hypothetical protein
MGLGIEMRVLGFKVCRYGATNCAGFMSFRDDFPRNSGLANTLVRGYTYIERALWPLAALVWLG